MSKKNIVYIGNQLSDKGLSPTSIDVLEHQLEEIAFVKRYSRKVNVVLRFFGYDGWNYL